MKSIAITILIINMISFLVMGYDKWKAKRNGWRVPELRIFVLALFGGATGVYMGMKVFRHKTLHGKFVYGIPLFIFVNIVCGYVLYVKVI